MAPLRTVLQVEHSKRQELAMAAGVRNVKLETLFEHRDVNWPAPPYQTVDSELEALASRKKAMSMITFPGEEMFDDPDYHELHDKALSLGLCVLHQPSGAIASRPEVTVYLLHPDESWRVLALSELERVRWSRVRE